MQKQRQKWNKTEWNKQNRRTNKAKTKVKQMAYTQQRHKRYEYVLIRNKDSSGTKTLTQQGHKHTKGKMNKMKKRTK
jgi:hypothetical protein